MISKRKEPKKLIENITSEQGLSILNSLWNNYPEFRKQIEEETEKHLADIDCDEVYEEVRSELDSLNEDDLFDRSGPSQHGYHDPSEMAMLMIEEALKPFQDQMERYFQLQKQNEAKEYCKGILKALFTYNEEADSQFADYATDCPGELFGLILEDWNKKNTIKKYKEEMMDFIVKECKKWSKVKIR